MKGRKGRPLGVVGLIGLVGCGELDELAPELIAASFDVPPPGERPDTLRLTFSEPLGPIAEVDPEHFRLSTAMVIDDGQGGALTVYYDLANHFLDGLPGQAGHSPDLDGPWPRHAFTSIARLERGGDDTELVLRLSYPLELPVCEALDEAASLAIPAAIFVHYGQAERPRIVDRAGNPLADIASHWLAANGVAVVPGEFPQLDVALAIACP